MMFVPTVAPEHSVEWVIQLWQKLRGKVMVT